MRELAARPELIRRRLSGRESLVIIRTSTSFQALLRTKCRPCWTAIPRYASCLTGSSARTLRPGGVLSFFLRVAGTLSAGGHRSVGIPAPGQAPETPDHSSGLRSRSPHEDLKAYVGTYLLEEIRAEGLVRSIRDLSRGSWTWRLCRTAELGGFTETGSGTAGVPARTVREHFRTSWARFSGRCSRRSNTRSSANQFSDGEILSVQRGRGQPPDAPPLGRARLDRAWPGARAPDLSRVTQLPELPPAGRPAQLLEKPVETGSGLPSIATGWQSRSRPPNG